MELPADGIERRLDTWPVARLATLGPGGAPQQVPIVFARHAGVLWSPIDAKPKAAGELGRVRNVRREPRVSLLLDHYDPDWTRLWWIRLDARAEVVEAGADPALDPVVRALRAKYPQYADTPLFRDPPLLLRFEILSVQSWVASEDDPNLLG
jgi:PPOX class probable F420-dependent enzyme